MKKQLRNKLLTSSLLLSSIGMMSIQAATPVFAESPSPVIAETTNVQETHVELPLLTKAGESITKEIVTSSGEVATVTITKTKDAPKIGFRSAWEHVHSEAANNGSYHVNYIRGVYNVGFHIDINDKKITSAYDLWYLNLPGGEGDLVQDNSTTATANFKFNAAIPFINGPSWTGALRAQIVDGQLVTTVR